MPAWLVNLLISLVVKFGLPAVLSLVKDRWPRLYERLAKILGETAQAIEDYDKHDKDLRALRRANSRRLRERCSGAGCAPRPVSE